MKPLFLKRIKKKNLSAFKYSVKFFRVDIDHNLYILIFISVKNILL